MKTFDYSTFTDYDAVLYHLFKIGGFEIASKIMDDVGIVNDEHNYVVTASDDFVLIHKTNELKGKLYSLSDVEQYLGNYTNIERVIQHEVNCDWVNSVLEIQTTMYELFYRHVSAVAEGKVEVLERLLVKPTVS